MKLQSIEPTELPEVQRYLRSLEDDSQFVELRTADLEALASLRTEPDGWDWADHDGGRVIDHLWLFAEDPHAQSRLAKVCHLRALAWEAALEPFAG